MLILTLTLASSISSHGLRCALRLQRHKHSNSVLRSRNKSIHHCWRSGTLDEYIALNRPINNRSEHSFSIITRPPSLATLPALPVPYSKLPLLTALSHFGLCPHAILHTHFTIAMIWQLKQYQIRESVSPERAEQHLVHASELALI